MTSPSGPAAGGPGAAAGGSGGQLGAAVVMVPAILRNVVDAAWSVGLGSLAAGGSTDPGTPGTEPAALVVPRGSGPGGGSHGGSPFDSITGLLVNPGEDVNLRLFTVGLAASAVTSVGFAFLMIGRRRRDERPPASDEELATAAATGYPVATGPFAVMPLSPAAATVGVDPGTGGTDVNLPRWRRPSLIAARKSDPVRDAHAHASVTFSSATAAAPVAGLAGGQGTATPERYRVRYRLVQLLDRPDELLGRPLDSLDEGDEVEVVERYGLYRRVVTPDGRQGWLHRMTLGDVQPLADGPAALEPESGETLLSAYLAARARA